MQNSNAPENSDDVAGVVLCVTSTNSWSKTPEQSNVGLERVKSFRSFDAAERTIEGIETMNIIRKGQIRRLAKDDIVGQIAFVARLFGLPADG